jgi:hypothetical protein
MNRLESNPRMKARGRRLRWEASAVAALWRDKSAGETGDVAVASPLKKQETT